MAGEKETTRPGYDRIGTVYARHRRPDPRVGGQISRALGEGRSVVNIGAGTGSYEPADRAVVAVEPSGVMISQRPAGAAPAVMAVAEDLPFADRAFDAAMAILTIHHWRDIAGGLSEMARVAGRLVVLSFDPVVHNSFWFFQDYLPEAAAPTPTYLMALDQVAAVMGADRIEVVDIPADCIDGFNWAYWSRPEIYLDPEVRACMSGVALLDEAVVAPAMERLREDLEDGSWDRRHGALRDRPSIDGGFRLVIRDR